MTDPYSGWGKFYKPEPPKPEPKSKKPEKKQAETEGEAE